MNTMRCQKLGGAMRVLFPKKRFLVCVRLRYSGINQSFVSHRRNLSQFEPHAHISILYSTVQYL